MRIWMHLTLNVVACFAGFLLGGLGLALFLKLIRDGRREVVIPVMSVSMIVFCFGGVWLADWFVRRWPARCPKCGRPAYAEGNRPIRYRCTVCEHIHYTRVRTNWGRN